MKPMKKSAVDNDVVCGFFTMDGFVVIVVSTVAIVVFSMSLVLVVSIILSFYRLSFYISIINSVSSSPDMRAVVTPAVMEPLTFTAVRPMSISGSTDISSPASAIGKLSADSTRIAANVAPPPTPATPNELIATITTNVTRNCGQLVCPTEGAIITASIAG